MLPPQTPLLLFYEILIRQYLFNPRFIVFSPSPLSILSTNTLGDSIFTSGLRACSCQYGHLEATYLVSSLRVSPVHEDIWRLLTYFTSPSRACSSPQKHLEATHLPSPHMAHSFPKRHLEAICLSR